jgi:alpha-beta hydrolase superfamily lysophospholipase
MLTPAPRIEHFALFDGYACAARIWDVAEPIGRIVCLHGIISHGGWYRSSCRHLAQAGFEVHMLDRRGSGLNLADRGDVDSYQTWLGDVESYLDRLTGELPRIVLGISWGGKLAMAVARHRPGLVDGLGLLCPGLFAKKGATPVQRLALSIAGALRLQSLRVPIPLREAALFTDSPSWQSYIEADPLTLRKITIRFVLADAELSRFAVEAPEQIRMPTLLMLAGRDRIIDNPRVRRFVERIGSECKQVIEYPEATHTLEFEPAPQPFFDDLVRWTRSCVLR